MKTFFQKFLYMFGFLAITSAVLYLNYGTPPNHDEAHAWNIARHLSLSDIFTISKTEGHPFLWYYVLMPIAKPNLFYPWSLYLLNYLLMLSAVFCLYKNAPFPLYLKYIITLSTPILLFYPSFARSYSLSILFLFLLIPLYPHRHKKIKTYLITLILLANTNILGTITAIPFGLNILCESIKNKTNKTHLIINFGLLEVLLLILQFYGYDTNIPQYTPVFAPLKTEINNALSPLNIYSFTTLSVISLGIFFKQRCFFAIFYQIFTSSSFFILFNYIHHGGIHHYHYLYINFLASFWIAGKAPNINRKHLFFLPLTLTTLCLMFNLQTYKINDKKYLTDLNESAEKINNLFPNKPQYIYAFSHFQGNIILPYLSSNIHVLNQTMSDFKSLKAFKETLYPFYVAINPYHLLQQIKQEPRTLLFKECGEQTYQNNFFRFNLKYPLNETYCLYDIIPHQSPSPQ